MSLKKTTGVILHDLQQQDWVQLIGSLNMMIAMLTHTMDSVLLHACYLRVMRRS